MIRSTNLAAARRMTRSFAFVASLVCACAIPPKGAPDPHASKETMRVPKPSAASEEAQADSEEILESGGELDLGQLPPSSVQRANGEVTAWGAVQVAPDASMESAQAAADTKARAELIEAIRAGITASLTDAAQRDSAAIDRRVDRVAKRILPSIDPPLHGFRRVKKRSPGSKIADGEIVLRVVARISAREDALISALTQSTPREADPGPDAQRVLDQLGSGHSLGSQ